MNLEDFSQHHQVEKAWGREIWLENNPLYCAKFLVVNPGWECSLHCHNVKTETFIVLEGTMNLRTIDLEGHQQNKTLAAGEKHTMFPGHYHQFSSSSRAVPALLLEVSTQHRDADVRRLIESRKLDA